MEPELVALATAGATALVQQMATDGWAQVRGRLSGFFSRGNGGTDEETLEGELEATRGELAAALADDDRQMAADLEGAWRLRIRQTLAADPAAADRLREILAELKPVEAGEGVRVGSIHNTMSGTAENLFIQVGVMSSPTIGETGPGRGRAEGFRRGSTGRD